MSTKPVINTLFSIALLSPVMSSASCLDSIDPAKNITTGDCDITSINQPANDQQRLVQNSFSTPDISQSQKPDSRSGINNIPLKNDGNLDNFDWVPADWYEVY